jgi:integrase
MGSKYPGVRPRGDAIEVRFKLKGESAYCYETIKWVPTETNLERASRLRRDIAEKIKHDAFVYADYFPNSRRAAGNDGTFFHYAQAWLDSPLQDWREDTRDTFKSILERIWLPRLHSRKVRLITVVHLTEAIAIAEKQFKQDNNKLPSASLYNNWLLCVRGVFETAVTEGALRRLEDPTQSLRNKVRVKDEIDPFDIEEADAIIELAYENYGDMWGAWFELGFYTGMRSPGELSAILWPQVDIRKGEIRVGATMAKAGRHETTKTNKTRIVLLNNHARHAVMRLRPLTHHLGGELFLTAAGGNVYNANFQREIWAEMLNELGVRFRVMYNMRHTYATFGLMGGLKPGFLAKQLGHSEQEFFKTYARWINGKQNMDEMDLMEEAIKKKNVARSWQNENLKSQVLVFKPK